jgi:hypothetical protein
MSLWTFHDCVPLERRAHLNSCDSFANIVNGLVLSADIERSIWDVPQNRDLHGYRRAGFRFEVPPFLYDAFFNAPGGYRAQYAVSAELGVKMNRVLIEAIKPKVVALTRARADYREILASIDAESAKVWIDEAEVEAQLFAEAPQIDYQPWSTAPGYGVGLRAPLGTRLVLHGGWLNGAGVEHLAVGKARRNEELHETGWS